MFKYGLNTFNYHFGSIFIEALTVFDIDYYKFNIGHATIYKLLEWSFNNCFTIFLIDKELI